MLDWIRWRNLAGGVQRSHFSLIYDGEKTVSSRYRRLRRIFEKMLNACMQSSLSIWMEY
jgi:hypothetical protein